MNKKTIIILSCILIFSIAINITVYALVSADALKFENAIISDAVTKYKDVWKTREEAVKNKEYSVHGAKKVQLKYRETLNLTESEYLDVYTDDMGYEYQFDNDNNMIGFYNKSQEDWNESKAIVQRDLPSKITKEQAKELALDYVYEIYSDDLTGFEFESIQNYDSAYSYSVTLTKNYGKDGFIIGAYCYVDVYFNGALNSCVIPDLYKKADFDEKLVEGITEQNVKDYAEIELKAKYGENLKNYEIANIYLDSFNGKYVLSIMVDVNSEINKDMPLSTSEVLYYDIENQ